MSKFDAIIVGLLPPSVLSVVAQARPQNPPREWLGEALTGAVFAVLGYAGRTLHEHLKSRRAAKESIVSELQKLSVLLEESRVLFLDQNYKARRLLAALQGRFSNQAAAEEGFDEAFFRMYDQFNDDEKELHTLIRSITITSLRRVNFEMREWLRSNVAIRRRTSSDSRYEELVRDLANLQLHLDLWHSKYEVHMSDPRRCLVYLADEKQHGKRFPQNLEETLAAVLR